MENIQKITILACQRRLEIMWPVYYSKYRPKKIWPTYYFKYRPKEK